MTVPHDGVRAIGGLGELTPESSAHARQQHGHADDQRARHHDEHRRAFLRVGFLPTHKRIRFVGKSLDGRPLSGANWHFTLGDFDFF